MRQFFPFLASVFTRRTLGFALLFGLALLVWFAGPAIAVDSFRPLASDPVRIACVLLLVVSSVLWVASGPLSLVAVAAVGLLVWQAGPSFSMGEAKPLAAAWVRGLLIAVLVLGCVLYWLYRLVAAMRSNDQFLANILSFGQRREMEEPAREELKDVAATVRRAVAQLRMLRMRGGAWRTVLEGKRYLYELPWFMVVGSPGAGKTTSLRSAGLHFPVTPGTGMLPRSLRSGVDSGTLHCDWWFANEAVLIDTAGRYATHDGDREKDPSEWLGFLALLRKHRTRAPINGVIVALSMVDLLEMTASQRSDHAVCLRDRLLELRQRLGIRFPVYVIVTKVDVLRGFAAYFQSLTSEGRAQPWGFTLAYRDTERSGADKTLHDEIGEALGKLETRLADGLRGRMSEEFDGERRRILFALPNEFSGALRALRDVLDPLFLDSRYDATQVLSTLRGVYFTSGAQADVDLPADPHTLMQRLQRLQRSAAGTAGALDTRPAHSGQGFFLQDVLKKVIFPEAHLVQPNLRWELRFRILRLLGHLSAIAIFVWLAGALASSFAGNRDYLNAVGERSLLLTDRVRSIFAASTPAGTPEMLEMARALTTQVGLDAAHPALRFTYGLYSALPVVEAGSKTYSELQGLTLLPPVLRRMEQVLAQGLRDGDSRAAYEGLRVYKLLHDRQHYVEAGGAASVREWIRRDSQLLADAVRGGATDDSGMAELAGRASMAVHFDALFADGRVVQAASLADESLIRAVQGFLDGDTATQRVYERAKLAMQPDAPPDFTLVRAIGPQVGTVFVRKDALPLDKGVPGLFTYDGYHRVFAPRIGMFVRTALKEDDWVMGRGNASASAERPQASDEWIVHVRKQYLVEYAMHWDGFLASLRTVGLTDVSGGQAGLGFDLGVLRQLAAPDSPLARLGREAVRETTLSERRIKSTEDGAGMLDKAAAAFGKASVAAEVDDNDARQLERTVVDNHFAALREVVTGTPDAGGPTSDGAGAKPRLDAISGLINDFYTWMVVADTALSAGGLPPGVGSSANGGEAGARLRLEAGKLPAPFKEILTGLAISSTDKVVQGATEILRRQAQLQLDRLMGLMALQVSEPCKRGVEGRYPFSSVAQDASIDDFTLVFASGGALDEFFSKYLTALVDTSVRPWRYKNPDSAGALFGPEALSAGLPALVGVAALPAPVAATGPTLLGELLKLLAREGPGLDAFYRGQQIRNVFFRDAGGKKMAWKMELTVRELEPAITELLIDIDGQSQRYVHGPVQPLNITWPGTRGGVMAELTAQPRVSAASSTVLMQGPWALFRLLDKGRSVASATPGRSTVEYLFDGRKALIELGTGTQPNPLNSDLLKGFRCPGRTA